MERRIINRNQLVDGGIYFVRSIQAGKEYIGMYREVMPPYVRTKSISGGEQEYVCSKHQSCFGTGFDSYEPTPEEVNHFKACHAVGKYVEPALEEAIVENFNLY